MAAGVAALLGRRCGDALGRRCGEVLGRRCGEVLMTVYMRMLPDNRAKHKISARDFA